jgi:autotransporter-associated beta strand protein
MFVRVGCALALAAAGGLGLPVEARGEVTTLRDGLGGYSGTTDSWVNYSSNQRNYGASPELRLRYYDGLEDNVVIRFDLAGQLPVHHNVTAATLKIYYYDSSSFLSDNVITLKPRRLTLGWEEGTGGVSGTNDHGVSWLYRDWNETQTWPGGAGGWGDSVDDGGSWAYIQGPNGNDPYAIKPSSSGATVSFNVTTTVQKWNLGQAANYGLVIGAPDMTGGGHYATGFFRSSDESYYVDYRPTLEITHELAPVTWTGATDGNWNASTANWTWTGGSTAFASGDLVNFGESTRTSINIVGTVTPGSVTFNNSAASNYTLSGGAIGGATGLTKSGAGSLTLLSANSYSGTTNISEGVVNIRHGSALGTNDNGTTVASGAALELQSGITVTGEALSIAGSGGGGGGVLRSVSGANIWTGQVTLAGAANTVGVDAGSLELSGKVTGAHPLSKVGGGKLILSSGLNDYSGLTTVSVGVLNVRASSALGTTASGTTVADGAALELEGTGFTVTGEALSIAGSGGGGGGALRSVSGANIWTGQVALAGAANTVGVDAGSLELSGKVTGAHPLSKAGGGKLILSSGLNDYSGTTTVSTGILNVRNGSALGSGSASVTVADTAALELEGTGFLVSGKPLYLAGSGPGGGGALRNVSGANWWTSTTTLTGATTIQSDAGSLGLAAITGAGNNLTLQGAAGGTVGGAITTGVGSLTKTGGGTWTLGGTCSYTGQTLIQQGTLALGSGGSISDSPTIDVLGGAFLDVNGVSGGFTLLPGQTLKGNGTVVGAMTVGGTLSPGESPGILYCDSVAFDSTGQFRVEIFGGVGGVGGDGGGGGATKAYDQLVVNGMADLTGAELVASLGYAPLKGTRYWIIVGADDLDGTFDGLAQGATFELKGPDMKLYRFTISYEGDMLTNQMTGGHDVVLEVPEPATIALLAAGAGAMLLVGRRRRRRRGAL